MTTNTTPVVTSYISYITSALLSSVLVASPLNAAPCIDASTDPDGDGWGYENGLSCTVESTTPQSAGTCVDYDGDGWGWNGVESCIISQPPQQPSVQVQSIETAPVVVSAPPVTTPAVIATPASLTTSCATTLSSGANLYNAISSNTGNICLSPGNYSLPNTLSFRSNQTLIALDPSNPPVIATSAIRTMSTTGRNNVRIDSVVIDGNGNGAREFGILVGSGSNNITLNNVIIRNTFGIGVGITEASNVTISGGTITNIGQDTRLRQAVWTANNSRNVTINGLTVRGRTNDVAGGDHAITCIDVNGFTVTNTRTEYAGSGAVAINNCSNIVVTNNELHNGREHGVDIVNGSVGAIVTGNNITGFDRSAMVFDDHDWTCGAGCGANPTEITVSNNRMFGNNLVNLARCKGIAVDSQMVINPSQQQLNSDWIRITSDNQVDSDSALFCNHIH